MLSYEYIEPERVFNEPELSGVAHFAEHLIATHARQSLST